MTVKPRAPHGKTLSLRFATLRRVKMCTSCRWSIGLEEGSRGVLCRKCREFSAEALVPYRNGVEQQCWRCDASTTMRPEGLERREVFCADCSRTGIDLANAVEYVESVRARGLSDDEEV